MQVHVDMNLTIMATARLALSALTCLLLFTGIDASILPDPATPSNDTGPSLPPALLTPTIYPNTVLAPAPASSNATSSDVISGTALIGVKFKSFDVGSET